MKKVFVFVIIAFIIGTTFTACKSHERCAAYGKINKIDTGKMLNDKSVKSI